MKYIIVLVITFFCYNGYGQISNIKTDSELENFVIKKFKYSSFRIHKNDSLDKTQYWFKGDFNHDNEIDLFIYGRIEKIIKKDTTSSSELFFVLGGKKQRKVNVPKWYYLHWFGHALIEPKVIVYDGDEYICLNYKKYDHKELLTADIDTIFIQYNKPMKFSSSPSSTEISSINFRTSTCFGTCPVFELYINSKREAIYNGIRYVSKPGRTKMIAEHDDWDYIKNLLQNIRVQELDSSYNVRWTDDQTGYLTIKFKDGTEKQIEDYGLIGTSGLSFLFKFLKDLVD